MKVVILNPYFEIGKVTVPSMGLGFLSYYLRKNNVDAKVIEPSLMNYSKKDVLDELKDADFLGMIMYTENRFQTIDFAVEAKNVNPNIKIVVGGPHVFSLDKLILEHYPQIDYVIRGDGEQAFLGVINGDPSMPNITYRKDQIIRNDLNIYTEFDNYRYDYEKCFLPSWKDLEVPSYLMKMNHVPIIASKGCPYQCTFCATPQICKRIWRGYSIKVLVEIMEELVTKYNRKYFRFYDALFYPNSDKIMELTKEINERKLNVHYRIDTHVGLHEKMFKNLHDSGCDILGYGIESGSDPILSRIKKNITRKQILESLKLAKKEGFWAIGYFMSFHPGETIEDVNATRSLMERFDVTNMQFFKIHPDTEFYEELKNRGEINDNIWFDRNAGINTGFGNEFYYCKELFDSATFSGKGVIM